MCFLFLAAVKNQAAGFQIVWSREIVEWVSAPDTGFTDDQPTSYKTMDWG